MQTHSLARRGATGALILAAALCTAAAASPAAAPKPVVTATLTSRGPAISGPRTWRPGAARIAVVSHVPDEELTLLHFRTGYSYARFLADGTHAQGHTATARAALRRIFAETIFDGGVDLFPGQSASFTVTVRPGTYYLGEMTSRPKFTPIRVAGAPETARLTSAAVVTATDSGYDINHDTLPAHGTITIRNAGTRPHRLNLIPVKPGTTGAELGAYLRKTGARDNAAPPPFALKGPQLGIADLSARQQMQLTYNLPAGTYALIDFDQDMTNGRTEASKGCTRLRRFDSPKKGWRDGTRHPAIPPSALLGRQRSAHPLPRRLPREAQRRSVHAAREHECLALVCARLEVAAVHPDDRRAETAAVQRPRASPQRAAPRA